MAALGTSRDLRTIAGMSSKFRVSGDSQSAYSGLNRFGNSMGYTETRNFTFDEISMWDWYDGVVRATGVSRQRYYFVTLAAWDIANQRKIYLLSELHTSLADKLKSLKGGAPDSENKQEIWNSFTQLFENYLRGYEGVLYVSCDEPAVGQEISCRLIDTKHLRTLSNYDVEKAVSEPACIYWFGLIA